MKKYIFLAGMLLSLNIHAADLVYCPEAMECSKKDDISSCKPIRGNPEYFDLDWMRAEGKINKGVYKLEDVYSTYEKLNSDFGCSYKNNDSGYTKSLSFAGKTNASYEAFYDKATNWYISGYHAHCPPYNDYKKCPLTAISAFILDEPGVEYPRFNISINEVELVNKSIYSEDDVLNLCGKDPICKVHLYRSRLKIAEFKIDIKNKLKITDVIQVPETKNLIKIEKDELFNVIHIYDLQAKK